MSGTADHPRPSPRREAAHALLDALSAYDPGKGNDIENEAAVQLALERLHMSEDMWAEATPMLAASLDLLTVLTYQAADLTGSDAHTVVSAMRTWMDRELYPDPD